MPVPNKLSGDQQQFGFVPRLLAMEVVKYNLQLNIPKERRRNF